MTSKANTKIRKQLKNTMKTERKKHNKSTQ